MASSITATVPIARSGILHRPAVAVSASPVFGLPSMGKKSDGGVRCSMQKEGTSTKTSISGAGASAAAAAVFTAAFSSPAAMALVDERMSTEGTGLPFGLSSNLLGWLLLGVFALIWSLYFVYTSGLDEDEESGLSL